MNRRCSLLFAAPLALAFALSVTTSALAQPDNKPAPAKDADATDATDAKDAKDGKDAKATKDKPAKRVKRKEKMFDLTAIKLDGSTRMPQLLYFLDRASTELERASLKRRSFVPEMVRSLDEDAL